MPYTQEELKNSTFYQQLIDRDEQEYLQRKAVLLQNSAISGSADDGSLLYKDREGNILLFEDPYTGKLYEDPSSKIIHNTIVNQLKDNETALNDILDRELREL